MGLFDSLILSLVGMGIVFAVLVALMGMVFILARATKPAAKPAAVSAAPAPAPATAAAPGPKMVPASGSQGEVKLNNVDERTAAMIMAITADELKTPLNQLRFISIKQVG